MSEMETATHERWERREAERRAWRVRLDAWTID